jgi:hypothetical protein
MKRDTLDEAVLEARRFILRASALRTFQDKMVGKEPERASGTHFNLWFPGMSAKTAAVRRSSLDLTKILARLRQEK